MSERIRLIVLFFASFKERAGLSRTQIELPVGSRVADLKQRIAEDYPLLRDSMGSVVAAVNQEFAFDEEELPDGAEVALFPPVSGGSVGPTVLRVSADGVDINELTAAVSLPTTGAAVVFSGMVRAQTSRHPGKLTSALDYEAYVPMAEAKLALVAAEIRERWPEVEGIAIVQRTGHLEVGEPTTVIVCTGSHRDSGVFEAARYGIDRLKEIVPVWKKEIGPYGETWIEGHYRPEKGD